MMHIQPIGSVSHNSMGSKPPSEGKTRQTAEKQQRTDENGKAEGSEQRAERAGIQVFHTLPYLHCSLQGLVLL